MRFHKRSVDGSGKCDIAQGGAGVHVAVYELDRREKSELDGIEGLGKGYDEEILMLPEFGRCHTYVANAAWINPALSPYTWYRDMVLAGCRALGFPTDYIRAIRSQAVIDDPDRDRHAANTAIVDRLQVSR